MTNDPQGARDCQQDLSDPIPLSVRDEVAALLLRRPSFCRKLHEAAHMLLAYYGDGALGEARRRAARGRHGGDDDALVWDLIALKVFELQQFDSEMPNA